MEARKLPGSLSLQIKLMTVSLFEGRKSGRGGDLDYPIGMADLCPVEVGGFV